MNNVINFQEARCKKLAKETGRIILDPQTGKAYGPPSKRRSTAQEKVDRIINLLKKMDEHEEII